MPAHNRGELRRRDAGQIGAHQCRFSNPLGACDNYKALMGFNSRRHGFQSRFMTRTQKEKGRVGGDLKWSAFKPVKIEIHIHPRAPRAASSRSWQTEGGRVRRHSLSRYTYSGSASCIPCNKSSCDETHGRINRFQCISHFSRALQGSKRMIAVCTLR